MPSNTNYFSAEVAEYRYFLVDIVSNIVATEIPFSDVTFSRNLKEAGEFSGSIAVIPKTENLRLYDNTMPGKMALYITRNNVCVWGGIVWSREYSLLDRTLTVNASEFTSYLFHRYIWKTFNYDLEAKAEKTTTGGNVKITLLSRQFTFPTVDAIGQRTKVKISFIGGDLAKYSNYYDILASPAPTSTSFYVSIPKLPAIPTGAYTGLTITSKVDTYDYTRKLIKETFNDFSTVEFSDEKISEPGVTNGYAVTYREATAGIVTITTSEAHGLVPGQNVQLVNVFEGAYSYLNNDPDENEFYVVTEVPSSTTYKFDAKDAAVTIALNGTALTKPTYPLKYRRVAETQKKSVSKIFVTSNVVTVETAKNHYFKVGDEIKMYVESKYKVYNKDGQGIVITGTPTSKKFTYALTTANTATAGISVINSYVNYSVPRRRLELDTYAGYPHNFQARDQVYVYGVDDPSWGEPLYSGFRTLTAVEAGGSPTWFQYEPLYDMSVEPGNTASIKKLQYKKKNTAGTAINTVIVTTSGSHGFLPGDIVNININDTSTAKDTNIEKMFDGDKTIKSTPSDTTFTYTDDSGTKNVAEQNIGGKVTRVKSVIGPISKNYKTITQVQRVGSTATITTSAAHGFVEDDYVVVESSDDTFNNSGEPVKIQDIISTTRFSYSNTGSAVGLTTATGLTSIAYSNFGAALFPTGATCSTGSTIRTITCADHGLEVNDWIVVNITNSESFFSNGNVPVQVYQVLDANTFTYVYTAPSANKTLTGLTKAIVTRASYVTKPPLTYVKSYGAFPKNADLGGIEFSDENYSKISIITNTIIGGNLINVGEHLSQYAENIDGFDYRIDCYIDTSTNPTSFKRKFVFIPRKPNSLVEYLSANPLASGQYAPASAFGADKLIFEYPGNISSISLDESAEDSATRMFVTADTGGAGGENTIRYSAASNSDLLSKGWPVLDGNSKVTWSVSPADKINVDNWGNYDVEVDLNKTAKRYLKLSTPPGGDYKISINGSLDPRIGSYNPGDWCQLVIDDSFIKQRLNSGLEPRTTSILRKIQSISVTVPNSPAFPENITLGLVPEWEVDTSG
jgi:hypothetical protein